MTRPSSRFFAIGPKEFKDRVVSNFLKLSPAYKLGVGFNGYLVADVISMAFRTAATPGGAALSVGLGAIGAFGLTQTLLSPPEHIFPSAYGKMVVAAHSNDVAALETLDNRIGGANKLARARRIALLLTANGRSGEWDMPLYYDSPMDAALRAKAWDSVDWLLDHGYTKGLENPAPFEEAPLLLFAKSMAFLTHAKKDMDVLASLGKRIGSNRDSGNPQATAVYKTVLESLRNTWGTDVVRDTISSWATSDYGHGAQWQADMADLERWAASEDDNALLDQTLPQAQLPSRRKTL